MLQNFPQHQKNMTPNTDAPDADAPNDAYYDADYAPGAADNYSAYPKSIYLSFRNQNCNYNISPNTKKQ